MQKPLRKWKLAEAPLKRCSGFHECEHFLRPRLSKTTTPFAGAGLSVQLRTAVVEAVVEARGSML